MRAIHSTKSLIDAATVVPTGEPLPDGVISRTELPNGRGHRYVFADKVLPRWFLDAAKEHGFVLVDSDPGGKRRGRDVSLEIPAVDHRLTFGEPGSIYN